jgi:hypothetical protein
MASMGLLEERCANHQLVRLQITMGVPVPRYTFFDRSDRGAEYYDKWVQLVLLGRGKHSRFDEASQQAHRTNCKFTKWP